MDRSSSETPGCNEQLCQLVVQAEAAPGGENATTYSRTTITVSVAADGVAPALNPATLPMCNLHVLVPGTNPYEGTLKLDENP